MNIILLTLAFSGILLFFSILGLIEWIYFALVELANKAKARRQAQINRDYRHQMQKVEYLDGMYNELEVVDPSKKEFLSKL